MKNSVTFKKFKLLCLLLGVSLSAGLAGCGTASQNPDQSDASVSSSSLSEKSSSSDGLTEVTLGMVPWPAFELYYLADQQGIFKKNGLKVKIHEFSSTTDNSTAFLGGNLDFCTYASGESISPYADKQSFKVIMPMDKSNGCEGLIAKKGINSIKDLKGKTVASQYCSVDHFLLLTLLDENGMSQNDINFVDMSIEEAGSSFVAGQCDAASIWDPYFTQAKKAGGKVLYDTSENPNLISDILAASNDMIENHPETVQAMVTSIYEAEDYWKSHEDEADEFMAKHLGVSADEFKDEIGGLIIPDPNESKTFFDSSDKKNSWSAVQNKVEKFMNQMGVLSSDIDCADMIDMNFINGYQPSSETASS